MIPRLIDGYDGPPALTAPSKCRTGHLTFRGGETTPPLAPTLTELVRSTTGLHALPWALLSMRLDALERIAILVRSVHTGSEGKGYALNVVRTRSRLLLPAGGRSAQLLSAAHGALWQVMASSV